MLSHELKKLIHYFALPDSFVETVEKAYIPLSKEIFTELEGRKLTSNQPMILGVQGTQGSGKSTCAAFLALIMKEQYGVSTVTISIDDLYHTQETRRQLADSIHPLLLTRGVPGTHDLPLMTLTLMGLLSQQLGQSVKIPRFDKSLDDRLPESSWDVINQPVDLIILEGWCVGLPPIDLTDLPNPINSLEADEDEDCCWRNYVAQQLNGPYQELYALLDRLLVIQAPSFECVLDWRLLQEEKLKTQLKEKGVDLTATKAMSSYEVKRFIQHYERLTRHAIGSLPQIADWVIYLDETHHVDGFKFSSLSDHNMMISTDLDGTLLDHHDYTWQAAKPAIRALKARNIHLLFNTSKTLDEVVALQKAIGLCEPIIVENGSALYIPNSLLGKKSNMQNLIDNGGSVENENYQYKLFGLDREIILKHAHELRDQYGYDFLGFSDCPIDVIATMTGLDIDSAKRAANKKFSEPIVWNDSEAALEEFSMQLHRKGIKILKGGRFFHLQGNTNKAKPLLWMKQHAAEVIRSGETKGFKLVCLGDNQNDVDMLNVADIAICVKSPVSPFPNIENQNALYTQQYGPVGWNQALLSILTT